ncbi:hypothetical protein [Rhodospira trueperi]|uniref:Uncharacterized protein n=1 Tax=Rhodospira trueperi TaxID=69960 RepID=A0A1G6YVV4_9PROT|nr:hypothetical protein [Rhodospira trueperi]SDD94478.1 hypothetical protein SAMN05421720_102148 [Rhodospira trueperi]
MPVLLCRRVLIRRSVIAVLALLSLGVALAPGAGHADPAASGGAETVPWPRLMGLAETPYNEAGEGLYAMMGMGGDGPDLPGDSTLAFGSRRLPLAGWGRISFAGTHLTLVDGRPVWAADGLEAALSVPVSGPYDVGMGTAPGLTVARDDRGRVVATLEEASDSTTGHPDNRPLAVVDRQESVFESLADGPGFRLVSRYDMDRTYADTGVAMPTRPMKSATLDVALRAVAREPVAGTDRWRYKVEADVTGVVATVNRYAPDYDLSSLDTYRILERRPDGAMIIETRGEVSETVYFLGHGVPGGADDGAAWFAGAYLTVADRHDDRVRGDLERLDEQAAAIAASIAAHDFDLAGRQVDSLRASLAELTTAGVAWRWHTVPTQAGMDRYDALVAATETTKETYLEATERKAAVSARLAELRDTFSANVFKGMIRSTVEWMNTIPTDPFSGLAGYSQFTDVLALPNSVLGWAAQAEEDAAVLSSQIGAIRTLERLEAELQAYVDDVVAARREVFDVIRDREEKRVIELHQRLTAPS